MPKIKPCRECGCKDILIQDCGYSSFNVGWGKCSKCGFEAKLYPCSCFPRDVIIEFWNKKNSAKGKKADKLREEAKNLLAKADKLDKS